MARVELPIVILDPTDGSYVDGAEATVQSRPSGSAATVYDAESGGSAITQPLASDAQGRLTGWVDRGRYQILIEFPDTSTTTVYFDAAPGQDGAVTTSWINDDAVTSTKIADDAVGPDQLADNAVDSPQIAANAVGSTEVADGAITTNKLASDSVDSTKLKDDVSTDSNRAVTTDHIRDSAVTGPKIPSNAIDNSKLADNSVTSNEISTLPFFEGQRTTTQNTTADAITTVTWEFQRSDTDNMVSAGSPGDIVVVTAGVYILSGSIVWISNSTGRREFYAVHYDAAGTSIVNGGVQGTLLTNPPGGTNGLQSVTAIVKASVGDILRFQVFQNSSTSLGIDEAHCGVTWIGKG